MSADHRTRASLLTPPGAGAIGVVRVAGPDAAGIVSRLFRSKRVRDADTPAAAPDIRPATTSGDDRLRYGEFVADGEVIDDVLVSRAAAGDACVVDISAHGGIRVIERILQALEQQGATFCEWRELPVPIWPARSAIDRECTETLVRARTQRAAIFLAWQRSRLEAHLEWIASRCAQDPKAAADAMQTLLARFPIARRLIDGATVALIGPANSGKSTLFNLLVGRDAALVAAQEGTTRDWVSAEIEVSGLPITLIDTAGRQGTPGALDQAAIEAGRSVARSAELSVLVLDASKPANSRDVEIVQAVAELKDVIIVLNKMDLGMAWTVDELLRVQIISRSGASPACLSAKTGQGVEELADTILRELGFEGRSDATPCIFTARQFGLVSQALSDLAANPLKSAEVIKQHLIGTFDADNAPAGRSNMGAPPDARARGEFQGAEPVNLGADPCAA